LVRTHRVVFLAFFTGWVLDLPPAERLRLVELAQHMEGEPPVFARYHRALPRGRGAPRLAHPDRAY
jgi:hypothetical protein